MTAESGQNSGDANKPNQSVEGGADGENKQRKVAKTNLEGQIPDLPEPSNSQSSDSPDEAAVRKDRKVAKTRLEMSRPTPEQIESAPQGPNQARKIEKTKLEMSRPILNEEEAGASKGSVPNVPPEPAITEPAEGVSAHPVASDPGTTGETRRVVPKTMLEIDRPRSQSGSQPGSQDVEDLAPAPDKPVERKTPKTMLEVALPVHSDAAKQIQKVAKTKLDVANLDAIGGLQSQDTTIPVKVRKTLTQERTIPSGLQNKAEARPDQSVADDSIKLAARKAAPAPRERFVAKTMLDHSVLSEQLVKSHEKEKVRAAYIAQEKANEPVQEFHEVDSNKMASKCAFTWTQSGAKTGRVKACDKCQTQVYDFSGVEMPEAEALIFKHESRKKFSLYKREDGKFMTRDCPVQAQRKRNLVLLCLVTVVVIICALASLLLMPPPAKPPAMTVTPTNSSTRAGGSSTSSAGNSTSEAGNLTSTAVSSPRSSTGAPTQSKDGIVHFEAGQTVEQNAAMNNSFFTPIGANGKSTGATTSVTTPSATTPSATTPPATPAPQPVTTTGTPESKYWDK